MDRHWEESFLFNSDILPPSPPLYAPLSLYERIDTAEKAQTLIVCDHASSIIPKNYGDLGLNAHDRQSHIAWDMGAAAVAKGLAARLRCPAILSGISRLVIDCNRAPGDPCSIPAKTCGIPVPGNFAMDPKETEHRQNTWFHPYHDEIAAMLTDLWDGDRPPAIVSVHSFTPELAGQKRPWHVGVLSNRDRRMAQPVLQALSARPGLIVGDNQPYSGREINHTLDTHGGASGLPHVSFELRQDLVADDQGTQLWTDILAEVLAPVLAWDQLYRVEHF